MTDFFFDDFIEQIKELCTKVVWVEHGKIVEIGNPKEVCNNYYKKLDENRNKKNCKYAVLVSNLELDKPNIIPIFKVRGYELADKLLPILGLTMGFGLIGFIDDFKKLVLKNTEGLKPMYKMIGLLAIAVTFVICLLKILNVGTETLSIPPFSSTPNSRAFNVFTINSLEISAPAIFPINAGSRSIVIWSYFCPVNTQSAPASIIA